MRTAVTTRQFRAYNPATRVATMVLPGTPVIIEGWDEYLDGTRTYMVETETGECNEAVGADALDFEADF